MDYQPINPELKKFSTIIAIGGGTVISIVMAVYIVLFIKTSTTKLVLGTILSTVCIFITTYAIALRECMLNRYKINSDGSVTILTYYLLRQEETTIVPGQTESLVMSTRRINTKLKDLIILTKSDSVTINGISQEQVDQITSSLKPRNKS